MNKHIDDIADINLKSNTSGIVLVEFGAGYSIKTATIINKFLEKYKNITFVPIDVSESACVITKERYSTINNLKIEPFVGTYDDYFNTRNTDNTDNLNNTFIYLWLGSTIGNMIKQEQISFLSKVNSIMSGGDYFMIGFDTTYKDTEIIKKAYNDDDGITREFLLNILVIMKNTFNLELSEDDFDYHNFWNEELSRIEMYLMVTSDTKVISKDNGDFIELKIGEKLHIGNSHKFNTDMLDEITKASSFNISGTWFTDDKYHMFTRLSKC